MRHDRPMRRAWASFMGLTLAGTLLAAVAGPAAAQSTAAAPSGTLVVGMTSDVDQMFPWKATQFQAVAVLGNIYGTLTELDQDLNVVPGLAESWEASEDGTTLSFDLRDGVTFQDGAPLTSADVKASLDAILDEATAAVARSSLASVTAEAARA